MAGSSSAMGLESQLLSQFTCKVCSAQLRKVRLVFITLQTKCITARTLVELELDFLNLQNS